MGFDQDSVLVVIPDTNHDDFDGANRRCGVSERGFALGELEPEVMNVLGSGSGTPSGERIRWETRAQPIGEGLWRGKVVLVVDGRRLGGGGQRHDWELEQPTTRIEIGGGFERRRRRIEHKERESGKDEIRE